MPTQPQNQQHVGSPRRVRWAHWGLVAGPFLMGAALLAAVWSSYRGVFDASETLIRGQADVLYDSVRLRLVAVGRNATDEDLQTILDELADEGLSAVAITGRGGRTFAHAGTMPPDTETILRTHAPDVPVITGDMAVVLFRPDVLFGRRRFRSRSLRPIPPVAMAFRPNVASDLRAVAARTLGIGTVAGLAFLIVAILLMRWSLRREIRERKRENERHLAGLGQLSAVMAHEIRNPLASLKGNAQLLARGLAPSDGADGAPDQVKNHQKAERVVSEAMRLETLTNDLLDFARQGELSYRDVDPVATLREAARTAGDDSMTIETDRAPPTWSMDPDRIRQVLANLIENARQAGDGRIQLGVIEKAGRLVYSVRDWGPGIADEDRERIFEPFFTGRSRGTGLGLAVARRLVSLHGGEIQVENAPEGGALFRVSLPGGNH